MIKIKEIVKTRIEQIFLKLEEDPSLMSIPYQNLKRYQEENYLHPKYLEQWEHILKKPLSEIKQMMLLNNEQGELLRSTSIFTRIT